MHARRKQQKGTPQEEMEAARRDLEIVSYYNLPMLSPLHIHDFNTQMWSLPENRHDYMKFEHSCTSNKLGSPSCA